MCRGALQPLQSGKALGDTVEKNQEGGVDNVRCTELAASWLHCDVICAGAGRLSPCRMWAGSLAAQAGSG